MRITGTLKTWKEDRGFGFIVPIKGGAEVFVHVSAFPRDGVKPRIGERLTYMEATDNDGKVRAVGVSRLDAPAAAVDRVPPAPRYRRPEGQSRHTSILGWAVSMLLMLGLAYMGNARFNKVSQVQGEVSEAEPLAPAASYQCDGRRFCGEMGSLAEAQFFLRNCPNTAMDGDNDGHPCESQFGNDW